MTTLLVDDHRLMREGLRTILERESLSVVGEAASALEAIAMARTLRPTIVIMNVSLPDLNGIDATRRLVSEVPGIKVIGLSHDNDRSHVAAMFKAGASGYLAKDATTSELVQAVRTVNDGLTYVSPSLASAVVSSVVEGADGSAATRSLSLREREVLQLLAEGQSSKDIARKLQLAVPTVETHRRQITDKLGIRTIAALTKYAIREGLTSLE